MCWLDLHTCHFYVDATAGDWAIVRAITPRLAHRYKNPMEMGPVIVGVIVSFLKEEKLFFF